MPGFSLSCARCHQNRSQSKIDLVFVTDDGQSVAMYVCVPDCASTMTRRERKAEQRKVLAAQQETLTWIKENDVNSY